MAVIINPAQAADHNFNQNIDFNPFSSFLAGGVSGMAVGLQIAMKIGLDVIVNNISRFPIEERMLPMPRICAAVITGGITGALLGALGVMDRNMPLAANVITAVSTGTVFLAIFAPPDNPLLESMNHAGMTVAVTGTVLFAGAMLIMNRGHFLG